MTDGSENGVGPVAVVALEIVAPEMAAGLEVSDDGLVGGKVPKFPLDARMDAALLALAVDPEGVW